MSGLRFSPLSGWLLGISLENTINVDDLRFMIFSQQLEAVHEGVGDEHFDQSSPYDASGTNHNTLEVFIHGKRDQFECLSSILDNEELADEDADYDSDEEIVIKELSEDIDLLFL